MSTSTTSLSSIYVNGESGLGISPANDDNNDDDGDDLEDYDDLDDDNSEDVKTNAIKEDVKTNTIKDDIKKTSSYNTCNNNGRERLVYNTYKIPSGDITVVDFYIVANKNSEYALQILKAVQENIIIVPIQSTLSIIDLGINNVLELATQSEVTHQITVPLTKGASRFIREEEAKAAQNNIKNSNYVLEKISAVKTSLGVNVKITNIKSIVFSGSSKAGCTHLDPVDHPFRLNGSDSIEGHPAGRRSLIFTVKDVRIIVFYNTGYLIGMKSELANYGCGLNIKHYGNNEEGFSSIYVVDVHPHDNSQAGVQQMYEKAHLSMVSNGIGFNNIFCDSIPSSSNTSPSSSEIKTTQAVEEFIKKLMSANVASYKLKCSGKGMYSDRNRMPTMPWTSEEIDRIKKVVVQDQNIFDWSVLMPKFPGRTAHQIKTRWFFEKREILKQEREILKQKLEIWKQEKQEREILLVQRREKILEQEKQEREILLEQKREKKLEQEKQEREEREILLKPLHEKILEQRREKKLEQEKKQERKRLREELVKIGKKKPKIKTNQLL